jgi:hypothetical protein
MQNGKGRVLRIRERLRCGTDKPTDDCRWRLIAMLSIYILPTSLWATDGEEEEEVLSGRLQVYTRPFSAVCKQERGSPIHLSIYFTEQVGSSVSCPGWVSVWAPTILWVFVVFLSPFRQCRDGIPIRQRPLPSKPFSIHHYLSAYHPILYELKLNSTTLVRERTMPTERPPLVGEVVPTFAHRGCCVVSATDSHGH